MSQRLAAAEWQPARAARLHPLAKLLSVKRSQRCRHCDHNLTKPEYNPGSIKFKIELLAYYHVPEVKIISYEPVKAGGSSALLLKLSNPTGHDMTVRLLPPDAPPTDQPDDADKSQDKSLEKSLDKSLNLEKDTSLLRWLERAAPAGALQGWCRLQLPAHALAVPRRDDAAEYDDDAQHDASDIILWRKSNKLALRLRVDTAESAAAGSEARAALTIEYSYRNTVPPAAAPRDHRLRAALTLHLGTVASP